MKKRMIIAASALLLAAPAAKAWVNEIGNTQYYNWYYTGPDGLDTVWGWRQEDSGFTWQRDLKTHDVQFGYTASPIVPGEHGEEGIGEGADNSGDGE